MTKQNRNLTIFDNIKNDIAKRGSEFEMMLPSHIDKDRFVMTIITAIQSNDDLMDPQVNKPSLYMSCMEAAQDGLLPNGKEAALVVFNTNIATRDNPEWIKKVQYMPMIQGLRKLVDQSGQIKKWTIQIVKEKDQFDYELGDHEFIKHKPACGNRGKTTYAYAIAHLRSGEISREIMDIAQLNDVRERSKNATKAVWNKNEDEMHRKTVGHRHYKSLPKSEEIDKFMQRWNEGFDLDQQDTEENDIRVVNDDVLPPDHFSDPGQPEETETTLESEVMPAGDSKVIQLIEGCNELELLLDLLKEVNSIPDFQEKKIIHKAWMKRKSELEEVAA